MITRRFLLTASTILASAGVARAWIHGSGTGSTSGALTDASSNGITDTTPNYLTGNVGSVGFNGHKLQTGVTAAGFPFMNLMKSNHGNSWWTGSGSVQYDPQYFDNNGYPTSLPNGSAGTQFPCPTSTERGASYYLITTGSGAVTVKDNTNNTTLFSGSVSGTGTQNALSSIASNTTYLGVSITTAGITDLAIVNATDLTNYVNKTGTYPFNPDYINLINKFGVLRFMEQQNVNFSNYAKWSDMRPDTYFTWSGDGDYGWFPNNNPSNGQYYGGTATRTAGGGANNFKYTISSSNFNSGSAYTPANLDHIICKFSAGDGGVALSPIQINAANPTKIYFTSGTASQYVTGVNIHIGQVPNTGGTLTDILSYITMPVTGTGTDGTGDWVTIAVDTSAATGTYSSGGCSTHPVCTLAINGGTAFLVDQHGVVPVINNPTNFVTLTYQSDPQSGLGYIKGGYTILDYGGAGAPTGLIGGWPISVCVKMANMCGAHPWFSLPFLACDSVPTYIQTLSNFATQLATYCQGNLNAGLIPRFEVINEVWNNSFDSTQFASIHGWCRDQYLNSLGPTSNYYPGSGGLIFDYHNWYGQAVSIVGQAIGAVYSGDQTKFAMLSMGQLSATGGYVNWRIGVDTTGNISGTAAQKPAYYYLVYNASGATVANQQRTYNWCSYLGASSYWQSGYQLTNYEALLAAAWDGTNTDARLTTFMAAGEAVISTSAINVTFPVSNGTNVIFTGVPAGMPVTGTVQACYVFDDSVWLKGTCSYTATNTITMTVTSSNGASGTYGGGSNDGLGGHWSIPSYGSPTGHAVWQNYASNGTVDTVNKVWYPYWYGLARSLTNNSGNVLKFCSYEGGYDPEPTGNQSLQGPGAPSSTVINNFHIAAKWASVIATQSKDNDNNFIAQGIGAEFPAEFKFAGTGYNPIWDPDIYAPSINPPPRWLNVINNFQ